MHDTLKVIKYPFNEQPIFKTIILFTIIQNFNKFTLKESSLRPLQKSPYTLNTTWALKFYHIKNHYLNPVL